MAKEKKMVRCKNCGVKGDLLIDKEFVTRCEACQCEVTYNEKKDRWE